MYIIYIYIYIYIYGSGCRVESIRVVSNHEPFSNLHSLMAVMATANLKSKLRFKVMTHIWIDDVAQVNITKCRLNFNIDLYFISQIKLK